MNTDVKLIKNKVGLLKLAEDLGKFPMHAKLWHIVVTPFKGSKICTIQAENLLSSKSAEGNQL